MHVAARARLVLARHPWLYWLLVAVAAVIAAASLHDRSSDLIRARDDWGETRAVLVATVALEPGDQLDVESAELPVAALPVGALTALPSGATLRQRLNPGEILTTLDVAAASGPAARAAPNTVVVGVTDPLTRSVPIGIDVQVAADGLVLAEAGTVVDVIDDVVFVAVARADGPIVASAAQQGIASLLFLP